MPVQKLKNYLDEQKVKYTVCSHSPAFTAQEIAAKTRDGNRPILYRPAE